MTRIFLSYRREDSAAYAGRLHDRLVQHFGVERLFMDIDRIKPGDDFVEAIERYVESSGVALVIIGPRWLDARTKAGRRRLDDAGDFVRMEVEAALRRSARVIPILVGGANMPMVEQLPQSMSALARRNAFTVRDTGFHQDVTQLLRALDDRGGAGAEPASGTPAAAPARQPEAAPTSQPAMPVLKHGEIPSRIEPTETTIAATTAIRTQPTRRLGWIVGGAALTIAVGVALLKPKDHTPALPPSTVAPITKPAVADSPSTAAAPPTITAPPPATEVVPTPAPVKASQESVATDTAQLTRMAWKYYKGDGVDKDLTQAGRLFKQAADAGDLAAQTEYAFMVVGNLAKGNFKTAVKVLQDNATKGEPAAMEHVADMHWAGNILRKDHAKAFALYTTAAKAGSPGAKTMLGNMYKEGQATAKDPAAAVRWYRAAADQGYLPAYYNLAEAYRNGLAGASDEEAAVSWHIKAARQGHAGSQSALRAMGRTW